MTTVAVVADPPRPGLVLPRLADTAPLSEAEAADCYAAMLRDVCDAVADSGGDLLVNYRPDDALPDAHAGDAEGQLRDVVSEVAEDARYEVQVGESFSGRVGNTVTHLLAEEGADSVGVVEPSAAFLTRSLVDSAAMKLRRSEVVLGPADGGRVHYAGFTDAVDFAGAYTAPAVETLTDRACDAGHEVDFLRSAPVVETGRDLAGAVALLRARRRAGRIVPDHLASFVEDLGLVPVGQDGLELARDTDNA